MYPNRDLTDLQKHITHFKSLFSIALLVLVTSVFAQRDGVGVYMNPVIPGSHPDQTLMKVGDDYYTAGSSFHWAPNFPIYHSTDLVHWEVVSTVVDPNWSVVKNNAGPKDGTWQGALAYFAGKYWAYFFIHGAGQFFCTAASPTGPWSSPTLVPGSIGYDNAVFVDDDGKAYMLMKNGQDFAAIQELNSNGQLTGTRMDMSWVNRDRIYSWAEGPKMCKRNGRYYYFVAGHVYGGQYVLSSPTLTANEASWTRHGNFFRGNASGPFSAPNHISQPVQISDGTWWGICHSYGNSGWEGQGRQSMLFQVFWDGDVPYSNNPNGQPLTAPNLPSNGMNYEFPQSDDFASTTRKMEWFVHNVNDIGKLSVSARPGFMRISPGNGTMHALQRDAAKAYSVITKVDINATSNGQHAGLRLMNGEDLMFLNVYSGYNNGKKFGISFNGQVTEVNNTIGNTAWLRLVRNQHIVTGFYSADGLSWNQIGSYNTTALDRAQENDNAWVGTAMGLYATRQVADFDEFAFNSGFSPLSIASYYLSQNVSVSSGTVTNTANGGWCMLPGVTMEIEGSPANQLIVSAATAGSGSLEVWTDNIGTAGTLIATIPITNTGGTGSFQDFASTVAVSGQHDLYFRFVGGNGAFRLNTVRFVSSGGPYVAFTSPANNFVTTAPADIAINVTATDANGTVSNVKIYNGNTLLTTDNTAPYTHTLSGLAAGDYELKAIATDNEGNETEAVVTIRVNVPQAPYGGTAHPIPGTIQLEEFDVGGNGSAYMDDTPGSETAVTFRDDEDVDLENCTDAGLGYNLGWTSAGEWVEYTVDVTKPGRYSLGIRSAVNGTDRTVSVTMDGEAIATDVAIPNTTGWQVWQTVTVNDIVLLPGEKVMRLTIGATDYVNLNYVTFTLEEEFVQEPFNSTAHQIPGKIEAEEYDLGGEGLAYHEANMNGNQGTGTFRDDEVDIEVCTDAGGGFNLGYTLTEEWLEYTVEVANTGNYDLDLRLAKDGDGGLFHIEMDDVDITGPIAVPNTGGWQVWETVKLEDLSLTAGEHIMRIVFDTDYTNLNYVQFTDLVTGVNHPNTLTSTNTIYPNPFNNDGFTIQEHGNEFDYEIVDILGNTVEKGKANNKVKIGTELPTGIYVLVVQVNNSQSIHKIVKK